jgi:hypothetical protein
MDLKLSHEHLRAAMDLLREDENGCYNGGLLVSLQGDLHVANSLGGYKLQDLASSIKFLDDDVSNMLTVLYRLAWMQRESQVSADLLDKWTDYVSLDVETWHVNFRSALDHAAAAICCTVACPDGMRSYGSPSFANLYDLGQKAARDASIATTGAQWLGDDWLTLLQRATWYGIIKDVRNKIVHRGAFTMSFMNPSSGILFQVFSGPSRSKLVSIPGVMFNENVVRFERYAPHFLAHFFVFLEQLAAITYKRLGMNATGNTKHYHFGLATFRRWVTATLQEPCTTQMPEERQGL